MNRLTTWTLGSAAAALALAALVWQLNVRDEPDVNTPVATAAALPASVTPETPAGRRTAAPRTM